MALSLRSEAGKINRDLLLTEVARAGGAVSRFHTERVRHQTVAEHTFGVLHMIMVITGGRVSVDLIKAALYHDVVEMYTGDTPAPVKWECPLVEQSLKNAESAFHVVFPEFKCAISEQEHLILKWADRLELAFTCIEQERVGNQYAAGIRERVLAAIATMKPIPGIKHLVAYARKGGV